MFAVFILCFIRLNEGQLICPYCDPNYVDIPGLEEACRGYDTPMGNPNPEEGQIDPGIRKQIFAPMVRDDDGHYVVDGTFVAGNGQIKCDGDLSSHIYDKFEDYVNGMMSRTTTGFGVELGRPIGVREEVNGTKVTIGIPPLFSRSWNNNEEVNNLQNFFKKEKGSITVTEAVCLTHRVDIFDDVKKVLLNGFVESVKALESANNASKKVKEEMFKQFIEEFGTHYQTTSKLGTRITVERRYTNRERKSLNKEDLANCANIAGAEVLGIQLELSKDNCTNTDVMNNIINSSYVDRMKVSTYGSFLAENIAEWTTQVISLVNEGKFIGRVIQRELKIISNLFTKENFEEQVREDGLPLDLDGLLDWFEPMLENEYCRIFNITCEMRGCGINDQCALEEWCIFFEDENFPDRVDLTPIKPEFICADKNVSVILPNGNWYNGSVHRDGIPHGWGLESAGNDTEDALYEGQWIDGRKEGTGTLYRNGATTPYYSGQMKKNKMTGKGVLYYPSGTQMFVGMMKNNFVHTGKLYTNSDLPKVIIEIKAENITDMLEDYRSHEISAYLPKRREDIDKEILI